MQKTEGFTITELMTLLSIVAVLSTLAFPGFLKWILTRKMNTSVHEIESALHYARMTAINKNVYVTISFDPDHDRLIMDDYIIFMDNGSGNRRGNGRYDSDEIILKKGWVAPGINMFEAKFGNRHSVRYNGMGIGQAGHIYLKNGDRDYTGIKVSMTGGVRIVKSNDDGKTWE